MADCSGHAPDLSVTPLRNGEFNPPVGDRLANADRRRAGPQVARFWDEFDFSRSGRTVIEGDALTKPINCVVARISLDLSPVGFAGLVRWIADLGLQRAIVGQNQQAFAVAIKPARRIHARYIDEVGQRLAVSTLISELRQDVEGFVEEDDLCHAFHFCGRVGWICAAARDPELERLRSAKKRFLIA